MLFHLYIILMSIVFIIELLCSLLVNTWLKSFVDVQAKVLLVVSAVPSLLAIILMEFGLSTISFSLAIVSVVTALYGFFHKMTDVDASLAPNTKEEK